MPELAKPFASHCERAEEAQYGQSAGSQKSAVPQNTTPSQSWVGGAPGPHRPRMAATQRKARPSPIGKARPTGTAVSSVAAVRPSAAICRTDAIAGSKVGGTDALLLQNRDDKFRECC
jgi:hypothetical protein